MSITLISRIAAISPLGQRPAWELGLIEMTVPDKPNSSKQQYRAVTRNSD
ncbi:Fic family protein [Desulfosporosinus sp. BG]